VEYLATVDCARWPDARDALIAALRGDKNECVRFAAAKAFGTGCCCSPKVIEALKASVSGEADKDPAELSPRVRGAAFAALQNCLARVPAEVVTPEPVKVEPEGPKVRTEGPSTSNEAADHTHITASHTVMSPETQSVPEKSTAQIIEEARQTLSSAAQNPPRVRTLPTGKRSVFHALVKARQDSSVPAGPIPPPPPTLVPNMNGNLAQPPVPDPNMNMNAGQGVVPTSFVVPAEQAGANAPSSTDPSARPQGTSKRSLAEIFLKSWNRRSGQ
jgi:hypothetical protein